MAQNTLAQQQKDIVRKENAATVEAWISSENIKKKFNDVLDKGAGAFVTSLLSLVKQTPALAECDPKTTIAAAMTAATLKLPINPNLGFAYIIPYKNKTGAEATFQIGYKGIIQLAMRTGQYKTINASVVHEGEIESVDFITGEIVRGKRTSDTVIGYISYFKLVNGFEKMLYMSREEVEAHAAKYSQSYGADKRYGNSRSLWTTNFDVMALKTVLKQLISKYGIMSIDMQGGDAMAKAINSDQAVIREDGTPDYIDNEPAPTAAPPQDFDAAVAATQQPAPEPTVEAPASVDFDAGEPNF